ncbi:MAG: FeS cluster assembly protein SufD [Ignavibacteria bacterium]|nr:FeS cluster assembly protein SufD [Ignavibacteria bacterium]
MTKTEIENTDLKLKLVSDFQKFEKSLNGKANSILNKIKIDAFDCFNRLGFPVKKLEEWKYTNINPVLKHDFKQSTQLAKHTLTKDFVGKYFLKDAVNLVFINGFFDESLSDKITDNDSCYSGSLAEATTKFGDFVEQHFSKYADFKSNSMTALNTAFSKDGAFIYLKKNSVNNIPVHILYISDAVNNVMLSQPRNLIVLEEGSSIKISEDYFTVGSNYNFTNAVTEIYCAQNSNLEHYKIQNDGDNSFHIGTTQVHQERDSKFSDTTVSWGGSIIRNNLNSVFNGTNTECHFYGLYLLDGKQHVDNHTLADHKMPNCFSNELYKGIIDGSATGVFNGKIMVHPDAQKTNAYQSNNNILLSDDATIYSKPQLEIFADDVKCSHGATSGQLSKEEMFYLRSRGISENDARILLLNAFASDVIDSVKIDALRIKLYHTLQLKLKS